MLVSLNGVIQAPLTSFSVSGSTITFLPSSGTLSSSDTIDFILVLGNTLDIGTPSDSTVTNAKTNFVSTSSSAGLTIKGDGTSSGTSGTLQLNCSANSHGIKLASPAHSAGQSYTLTFPTTAPSADKALITDGSGNLSFGDSGGLVKVFSSISSSAVSKVETDLISSTYDNYLLVGNIVATDGQNSSVDIYLRASGSSLSSTGNDGINVYQGEYFNRAGDAGVSGNVLNGSNAYLRIPTSQNIYGGSVMSFVVQFNVLYGGLVTGTTNLTSPTNRLIRNGWFNWSMQSVSSSDYYGAQGWFRMDNPNQNISAVTGIKINSGASNFTKHNVALFGYVK
jgi:hypothetical protein